MRIVSTLAALAIPALLLASCSGNQGSRNQAQTSPTTPAPSASASASAPSYEEPRLDELVPVGEGRKLHTTCWGHGSPAVVFLHGRIMPYDDASWAHRPDLRERIAPRTTYCEYERTNVGTSSTEKGPIPLTESAADLNALLDGIGIEGPVVLLAGSYGGVLGTLFAGTYPDRLAGIVLLDPELAAPPQLPGCPDTNLDHYVPARYRLTPNSWKDNAERSDDFHATALAARVLDRIPRVPGVLFAATQDNYPPGTRVKPFMNCLRAIQRNLAGRFRPARMVVLEGGHDVAETDADRNRIAAAVLRIVRSSR
jgi:pimeloyl-ACP methyl ester carboxylesterase